VARHARAVDRRTRTVRVSTVAVVWICGLTAGFFALLSAAARYGCGAGDKGLACRTSGSVVGILVVIAVIVVVTTVTVMSHDRPPRRLLTIGLTGVAVLTLCFLAARALLGTV
jgi:hypothetical protein